MPCENGNTHSRIEELFRVFSEGTYFLFFHRTKDAEAHRPYAGRYLQMSEQRITVHLGAGQ